jgi:beta-phosphoglucomutase-like phosphatase (HAD superfamily)
VTDPSPLLAVIFDFDGVLADSEPLHFEAFRRVLAAAGIALGSDEYYADYLGYDDVGAFRAILRDRGRAADDEAVRRLVEAKLQTFPQVLDGRDVLFAGASACVRRLAAQVPLAIASGALSHDIDLVLAGSGIRPAFHAVVAADHTAQSKPHPEPYLRAVETLQTAGLVPADAGVHRRIVAIEDSRWGLQSAHDAGLRTVAVTTSYDAHELETADLVVRSLDEITVDRLEALVGRP